MTKSFALSNELRERVVDQLTQQAVAKHGKRIGAALKKMNEQFWKDHAASLDRVLQIDTKRYPELIAAGVFAATTTVTPTVSGKGEIIRISYSSHNKADQRKAEIAKLVLRSSEFGSVADFIKRQSHYNVFELRFTSSASVPRLNDMHVIESSCKMATQAAALQEDLKKIFEAADDFREKAIDILRSCRTSRQLTDIFPEAAKLLPQPEKKSHALAPIELVDNVRQMLTNGIPTQAAAE